MRRQWMDFWAPSVFLGAEARACSEIGLEAIAGEILKRAALDSGSWRR